jgi:mycothiol synthase
VAALVAARIAMTGLRARGRLTIIQRDTGSHCRLRERRLTRYNESCPQRDPSQGKERMDQLLAHLRPYRPDDLPMLTELIEVSHSWPPAAPVAPDDIVTRWDRRHIDPEREVSVLPGPSGELAAYSMVALFSDPNSRVSVEVAVHPDWRKRGIGSALFSLAEQRARQLQVPHITTPLYLRPGETRPESAGFLAHRGFFPSSSYWQMRLDRLAAQQSPGWPEGFGFRVITNVELDTERWAELIREAFLEPSSGPKIAAQLSEPGSSPDSYFFAVEKETGLEVGTSRARIDTMGGRSIGYVGTVGVLPEFRNRGLATALISQTLHYLASHGLDTAVLFVEGENLGARRLYEKLGWQSVYQTVHYWKTLTSRSQPEGV